MARVNATAEQGAAALTLAVQLYRKECDRSGIHEKRFPSWKELDSHAKRLWIETAEQQLGIGVKIVTDTKTYIGTKVVKGTPMTRGDYNHLRGWSIPVGENPADAGYLVEYLDGGAPNHPDYENYISWSPAAVFEKAYAPSEENLTFGQALELLKAGKRLTRAGWNGAGQFVYLLPGGEIQSAVGYGFGEYIGEPEFVQTLVLKNAQNKLYVGWTPSVGDLFAKDWKLA